MKSRQRGEENETWGAQKQNIIYVLNLGIELYNTTLFNGFKKIKITEVLLSWVASNYYQYFETKP